MQDIIEARKRIRDLLNPVRRGLTSYHLEETLGYGIGANWNDDEFRATIEINVHPLEDYPGGEHEETDCCIRVTAPSRVEAIAAAYAEVEKVLPKWARDIELDIAFSKAVGKQVQMIRKLEEFIINQDEERRGQGFDYREDISLPPGTLLDVVGHEPGKLICQLDKKQVSIHFWKFMDYYIKSEGIHDPGIKVPDPYLEFTDGYAPWELPGVEMDHDMARSGQG